ncbi:hypothetical protein OPQ81_002042 [Rhizoctonia solani]|nr:hypothetical protein OPQ81_002042 [Rhizoctonia solani]
MSNYFALRIAGEPKRILYASDEHTVVEIAVIIARDMALHGYLDESAMVVAPIWNSAIQGRRFCSLDFVRGVISRFGLDLIWRGAKFVPIGFDTWVSGFDMLGYTDDIIEVERRLYLCTSSWDAVYDESPAHPSWLAIQSMLAVWEDPNTHILYFPVPDVELDALKRLDMYINQGSLASPDLRDYRACILGLELALKYDQPHLVREFLGTIAIQVARGDSPVTVPLVRDLALIPRIGYIVRNNSILRHATGFTRFRAREVAFEAVQALDSRFHRGEPRPYASLPWASLLSETEALESKMWEEEPDLPFIRPPASPERIARVEKELEITLPQDYKDFLTVSNGLGSYDRCQVSPLLPVEEIFWIVGHDELKVEYRRSGDLNPKVGSLPPLHRVLQVGGDDDDAAESWWLIEPDLIKEARNPMGENGPAEWLGVNYAEWNPRITNQGSFRLMMERRLYCLLKEKEL